MADIGSMPATTEAVAGAFTGTGAGAQFVPIPGRGFNIHVTGTFDGTVIVERYLNGTWGPKWPFAGYQITEARSFTDDECQNGVPHRLRCTVYVSGTATWSLSQ